MASAFMPNVAALFIQHNDIQHKQLICDTQHNSTRAIMLSVIMLNVTFHLLLCCVPHGAVYSATTVTYARKKFYNFGPWPVVKRFLFLSLSGFFSRPRLIKLFTVVIHFVP
jgi:hypothetical protein